MRCAILGLGSIGQRHLRSIRAIARGQVDFYGVRAVGRNLLIENGSARVVDDLASELDISLFGSSSELLESTKLDFAVISNPSSEHFECAKNFLENSVDVFIEKPLCETYSEAIALKDLANRMERIAYVGYQTNFSKHLARIKRIFEEKILGKVVCARLEWGTFLPHHHAYEDYKRSYAARDELGGGVLLGLSHELDILVYLFGSPEQVTAYKGRSQFLDIQSQDTVLSIMEFSQGVDRSKFPVTLTLSYAQFPETRKSTIHFEKGCVFWDLISGNLEVVGLNGISTRYEKDLTRDSLFYRQMINFMDAVKLRDNSINNLERAAMVMDLTDRMKASMER